MLRCVLVQSYSQSPLVRRRTNLTETTWIIQRHLLVGSVHLRGGSTLQAI